MTSFIKTFFAIFAIGAGLIIGAITLVTNIILSTIMLASGAIFLFLDAFAIMVYYVDWKYYSQKK